ncbi:hypothetical protein [Rhizobium mesoamericanum]|uniref:hypothetical protein n=1 Tax=Rhizobium mesoamericanum TaxID=1079800 RepID=UPI0004112FFB|nr:hypothetical protein [Rhizobium mesoamericanum]
MRLSTLASLAALSLAIAASPVTLLDIDGVALAKGGGNGGGNGGGSGGGGGGGNGGGAGHGNSENHGSGSQSRDNHGGGQGKAGSKDTSGSKSKSSQPHDTSSRISKSNKPATTTDKDRNLSAQLAGLNSLNRNYKALMNTSDPRMAAVKAYALAYAQYELDNGAQPAADDPVLGDAALEKALESATKNGTIGQGVLDEAKDILGVGDADGKIDQIRDELAKSQPSVPVDEPSMPVEEPTAPVEGSAPAAVQ